MESGKIEAVAELLGHAVPFVPPNVGPLGPAIQGFGGSATGIADFARCAALS